MKKLFIPLALVVGVGAGLYVSPTYLTQPLVPTALAAPEEQLDTSRPSTITAIQSLGRLETYSMEIEKIMEAGTWGGNLYQEARYKDRMLFLANGSVVAGFDLQNLSERSVTDEGSTITVNLGRPKILFSRLDNDNSRVYDRDVGILNSADPHLESRTRATAETTLREAACDADILDRAGENGQRVVGNLLRRIFSAAEIDVEITVIFEEARC